MGARIVECKNIEVQQLWGEATMGSGGCGLHAEDGVQQL